MPPARLDFAHLFREHYPRIYRYVRYRIADDMIAEDLTAEVFERAYRHRDSYDPARGAFSTWITRIAHNWISNYLLSQNRQQPYQADSYDQLESLSSAEKSPEAQLIAGEAIQRLLGCVELLPPRDRQMIALRFGAGLRNKDIAELMELKEHSVSVMLLRTLERLRACQEEP